MSVKPIETKDVPVVTKVNYVDKMSSQAIEDSLTSLLYSNSDNGELLKYNMRLFGLPHQYTDFCDYRAYSPDVRRKSNVHKLIGRKFIENIMLEAPVVTLIPGKPLYLPGAKNKQGLSSTLLSAANGSISGLVASALTSAETSDVEKQRYYDFQPDYLTYMKYVNIMCAVSAAFLDVHNETIDGVKLSNYDWKNYRWNSSNYSSATGNAMKATANALTSFVVGLKTYGEKLLNTFNDNASTSTGSGETVTAFEDTDDKDMLESLEDILTQVNFVQFYVDASSGMSESASNGTSQSKIEGMLDSGSELFKEVAFLANSGGIDANELQGFVNDGTDALNEKLFGSSNSALGGLASRLLSAGSNVIKGDNMIFPEIYQNSSYTKSYNITVDLRSPYGDKLSYYLNVLVPLLHLVALTIPKQTTANTYGSPFLIKAYFPGVFSCNLGIVESLTIDKNPNSDSWTVDGYPSHMRVTLSIKDLYSDLSMTPAGANSLALFMANSSLIEYLATNCGVSLITPQLGNRVANFTVAIKQSFESIDDNVSMAIFGNLENLISSLTRI